MHLLLAASLVKKLATFSDEFAICDEHVHVFRYIFASFFTAFTLYTHMCTQTVIGQNVKKKSLLKDCVFCIFYTLAGDCLNTCDG